ncbi:hypothetical protein, partial [Micromonospora harpali]
MDNAGYEALMAEYAEIEERLYTRAVLRDYRLGHRLRRQLEAMEAVVVDGSPGGWDPYDPYDVMIRVEALRNASGEPPVWPDPWDSMRLCRHHADRFGWKTVPLNADSALTVLAVRAGESGP